MHQRKTLNDTTHYSLHPQINQFHSKSVNHIYFDGAPLMTSLTTFASQRVSEGWTLLSFCCVPKLPSKQPNHEVTYHVRLLAYTCPVCLSGIVYGYKSPSDTNVLFLCTTSFNNTHTLLRRNAYGNREKTQRNTC